MVQVQKGELQLKRRHLDAFFLLSVFLVYLKFWLSRLADLTVNYPDVSGPEERV
jgi:hypothetical protein